jgi:PEP-CTERM motif-containing protein
MKRVSSSLALAAVILTTVVPATEGAIIRVRESSDDGSGSIMNDGGADVKSSNGSSLGDTSLMSELGLTNGNLAADLLALQLTGSITDIFVQGFEPAVSAEILVLRLFGMAAEECAGCATLSDAAVGSVGLFPDPNDPNQLFDPANVLFAVNLVGPAFNPDGTTWTGPGGLASPLAVGLGDPLSFQLTQAQVNFIITQMAAAGLGVGDIRIGLGARAFGVTATADVEEPVESNFAIATVPEPGSLLLFGYAAAALVVRRRLTARTR